MFGRILDLFESCLAVFADMFGGISDVFDRFAAICLVASVPAIWDLTVWDFTYNIL